MDAVQAVRNRILQLCEEYDLSINRLATLSALPPSSLKNILYGKSQNPKLLTIKLICDGLELNIRISVLIELKKIYRCAYDDFFAGLDNEEHREKM